MATQATMNKPNGPARSAGATMDRSHAVDDAVARRIEMAGAELRVGEQLIARLELENEDLSPGNLQMSVHEREYLRRFHSCETIHDVTKLLAAQRGIRKLREYAADPAKLEVARQAVEAAREEEFNAKAAIEDLDVQADGTPMLAKQIGRLQERLAALTAKRIAAENEVASIEGARKRLCEAAPKWLREQTSRDLHAIMAASELWRSLQKVRDQIALFDSCLKSWRRHEALAKEQVAEINEPWCNAETVLKTWAGRDLYVNTARLHYPAAFVEGTVGRDFKQLARDSGGTATIDVAKFGEAMRQCDAVDLPRLRVEEAQLAAKWNAIVADVERDLMLWVETGEVTG